MLNGKAPRFFRSRTVIVILGVCMAVITLALILSTLLTIPSASIAATERKISPLLDPALLLTAVVIPITFLIIILTRSKRGH